MKKYINVVSFLVIILMVSCDNAFEENHNMKEFEDERIFKFTEQIEIFSSDSTSSALVNLSSDNEFIFNVYKSRFSLITDDSHLINRANNDSHRANGIDEDIDEDILASRLMKIEILSITTNNEKVGFGLSDNENILKAQNLPWKYTSETELRTKTFKYHYVKYYYVSTDVNGVSVEFGFKKSIWRSWSYPNDYTYYFYGSDHHGSYVGNPKNNDDVRKLGTRVITNLEDKSNFYDWVSKREFPE